LSKVRFRNFKKEKMILEIATIDIKNGTNADFEKNLTQAQSVISKAEGYISHEFQHCLEQENRYVLLIRWETLEAHTIGFRGSPLFVEWRGLIGSFFEVPPTVQHFKVL
jgi:heme-degrading monooxygenase HmoA